MKACINILIHNINQFKTHKTKHTSQTNEIWNIVWAQQAIKGKKVINPSLCTMWLIEMQNIKQSDSQS